MRYVVIGASAAGISTVKKLRELNPEDEIILISKDERSYSRCILFRYLEGTRSLEEIELAGMDFEEGLQIRWIKGINVRNVQVEEKEVLLENGKRVSYDKLCIASGAHTNYPPIPGLREAKNVVGFRNLEDVERIKEYLKAAKDIFVMGAGLVGIDVIEGLLPYQKRLTLADMGPYMMPIQLDEYTAKVYQDLFVEKGVKQYYKTGAREFVLDERGNCTKVILQNGIEIKTDLVINCAGVRPNIEFLQGTELECDRFGIVTDKNGRTNVPDIFAAGDVTGRKAIWPVAVSEGIAAAYSMSGKENSAEDYFSVKASMYFLDLATVSIGNVNQYDQTFEEEITQDKSGNYMKLVWKDEVLKGALLQGDLDKSGILAKAVHLGKKRSEIKELA
ncbi:MAG: FAD-dependent oxidoreductase [Faecalicatena sp.]|uniref:NAD(P)/FAD-dependent oxidoreductase n=1 Tax=Faecalicatena sp. TaxID=2005360 RepID=UPI00258E7A92|nr:FAD-dependent oxidoreductase [Faecalicatena sp.]MCI6464633.1 FAD-dependent oxidoreductase [Faecalicatena sp.]MDY5618210.1 FAD-dependent oxidoreductase [Lachnospiraceae bacterium]